MVLRILRWVNRMYAFAAFGVYAVAFVIAFVCVFTFPLGALVLVVLGVLSLAVVALGRDALQAIERWMGRRWLRAGRCPQCRMGPVQPRGMAWTCRGCNAAFASDGSQEAPEEPSSDTSLVAVLD
ncbi:MAG: hypothetical protein RLZZ558_1045 [Planctomycetota bacterium]|jgi:ribosomal protein L37AE/L43A